MSGTTARNALPYPELEDEPNIEQAVKPLADAVDSRLNNRFTTTTERTGAIPTPIQGEVSYISTTDRWEYYDGSIWRVQPQILGAYKPFDEPISNTTMQDDDHLFLDLKANAVYVGDCFLVAGGDDTGDIKTEFSVPANTVTTTGQFSKLVTADASTTTSGSADFRAGAADTGTTTLAMFHGIADVNFTSILIKLTVMTGATPGQIRLRWAQSGAHATPTVLKRGSSLVLYRFA